MRLGMGIGRRMVVIAAVAVSTLPFATAPAHAAVPSPVECTAAGTITTTAVLHGWRWDLAGKGSCGDINGQYFLDFAGTGTSDTLGVCDGTGLVQNLSLNIQMTLTNAQTAVVQKLVQNWSAPLTTYPLATPFAVSTTSGPGGPGAGLFFNHIYLQCPGNPIAKSAGTPVAQFDWLFLR